MNKKILIRCDSSLEIGTGHVTRCINLAKYLNQKGLDIIFAARKLNGNINNIIQDWHFKLHILSAPSILHSGESIYDSWRGVPLNQEISEFKTLYEEEKPQWVIVDHYGLPKFWETTVKSWGVKLFAIDDLLRQHDCDALLDQNYHKDNQNLYTKLIPSGSCQFLGPSYALLSSKFQTQPIRSRNFEVVKNILVFFGGSDISGETLRFINIIKKINYQGICTIVVGINNPSIPEIKKSINQNFKLHIQTNEMPRLMSEADLFVGACGSTTWERSFLGLPAICLAVAQNQIEIGKELEQINAHFYLGESRNISELEYINGLKTVLNNSDLRRTFSEQSLKLRVSSKLQEIVDFI